jgi:hypothetical protein
VANDPSTNPWILDTVTTTPVLGLNNVNVEHFEFVGYTVTSDTCQVKNGLGKVIWDAHGASDLEEVRSGKVGWTHGGLYLSALTPGSTGKVKVYIK